MSRQSATEPAGDVLHERRVREDQPVAQPSVARTFELLPENTRVSRLVGHRSERIRCLAERPVRKLSHPHRKRTGRGRNHPGSPARAACKDRDRGEADGQNEEENAEGSPSHLGIMRFA